MKCLKEKFNTSAAILQNDILPFLFCLGSLLLCTLEHTTITIKLLGTVF